MSDQLGLSLNMSEDENCEFITTELLAQTGTFDAWLDTRGVQFIITEDDDDELGENMLDPMLNQIDPNDETFDPLNDSEIVLLRSNFHTTNSLYDSPRENENVVNDGEFNFSSLFCKLLYLDNLTNGLYVDYESTKRSIKLNFTDNHDRVIFPAAHILLTQCANNIAIPRDKVQVTSVEKIVLDNQLDAYVPCLHLRTGLKVFLCPLPQCNIIQTKLSAARMHVYYELEYKPYKCSKPGCTWAFYTSFKLRRHEVCHELNKKFICSFENCGRKFKNIYNLNIHFKSHSRPANLPCTVKNCTQNFQTSRARDKHMKTHDKADAPFQCPIENCNRSFFLMTGLSSHSRSHSHKLSEIRCADCGKLFEQPCRLKEHQRTHTGLRPYPCEHCKWNFPTASKLKRHQSTHTKERKFHCTMGGCSKSFARTEHLREHTLTHVGKRSFKCRVCKAPFKGKSSLCAHMKKMHPGKSKACARAEPYTQPPEQPSADVLLEQAIQSLGVPSDMILGAGLLPEEPLELLENENISTINLRDLD